jgi:RNase adaptor protein for sRNA GlmZ degradation
MNGKSIQLFSLGAKYGLYPGAPTEYEAQYVFDVRHAIKDPYTVGGIHASGHEHAVREYILSHAKDWLEQTFQYIKFLVDNWLKNSHEKTLKIYFTCRGGYQRSVVCANIMAERIRATINDNIPVTVQHLTIDLCRRTDV